MSPELVAAFASVITAMAVFVTAWRQGVRADERASALAVKTEESAQDLKQEVSARAGALETKTDETAAAHQQQLGEVKILVNGRMDAAQDEIVSLKEEVVSLKSEIVSLKTAREERIDALEEKLGLAAGADIPASQILTAPDGPKEETTEVTSGVIEVEKATPKKKRKRK